VQYPSALIDIHTHLFNARYIPLEAVLHQALGAADVGHLLSRPAARLLNLLTGGSLEVFEAQAAARAGATGSTDEVDFYADAIWGVASHQLAIRIEAAAVAGAELRPEEPDSAAGELLESDELFKTLREIEALYHKESGKVEPSVESAFDLMTRVFARWSPHSSSDQLRGSGTALIAGSGGFELAVRWLLKRIAKLADALWWDHAENLLKFLFTMLSSERDIVRKLKAGYSGYSGPTLFVHAMMDMKHAYDPPNDPWYDYPVQQLRRMQQLGLESAGGILGFAAFDPRRENWSELMDEALKQGFVGFKFYPPMGYKPIDKSDTEVNRRINKFFRRCVKEEIPVFAHCTPQGFEATKGAGLYADPRNWRKRLEADGCGELRLCLAHAGGERAKNGKLVSPGWDAKPGEWDSESNFAREVVALCREFKNVYCEVGHLHGVLESKSQAARFRTNLLREWREAGPYALSTKMMYGSDWHMPAMIDDTDEYLRFFVELFSTPQLEAGREAFFSGNARTYLALDHYVRRTRKPKPSPPVVANLARLKKHLNTLGT
jgi:predicted TIM-barrel fold metal-dependent hydrolase